MSCYSPLRVWKGQKNENGKYTISWQRTGNALEIRPYDLPCGKCVGCRMRQSQVWAMRCVHEAQMHSENSFVTLTYDKENLPENGSLNKEHFVRFLERLKYRTGKKIRYFQVGEYGKNGLRPHHHALLFGHDFRDKELFFSKDNLKTYTSKSLTEIWEKGHTTVQEVNYNTARYAARYCIKKIGAAPPNSRVVPEYATMSRNPGIGSTWYDKYKDDVYNDDHVVIGQIELKPPRYYDEKLAKEDPRRYNRIKFIRENRDINPLENDTSRRYVKEYCAMDRLSQNKRPFEEI